MAQIACLYMDCDINRPRDIMKRKRRIVSMQKEHNNLTKGRFSAIDILAEAMS